MFGVNIVEDSKIGKGILEKTPILTNVCDKSLSVINEIGKLKDEYTETTDVSSYNQKVLNLMIENGVITKDNAQTLIDKKKINGVLIN